MPENTAPATWTFVVPCGAAKAATATPARDLYTSATFRHILGAAEAEAAATARDLGGEAQVLILSARHGLLPLDAIVEPYNTKMGDADAITPEALADQVDGLGEVTAMLPKAYAATLNGALVIRDLPTAHDAYEAAPGIGYQRGVASSLVRWADHALPA